MSNVIDLPVADRPTEDACDKAKPDSEAILTADGAAESRAHAFRGALSTLEHIPVTPGEFWAVFAVGGVVQRETEKWLVTAFERLSAIRKAIQ